MAKKTPKKNALKPVGLVKFPISKMKSNTPCFVHGWRGKPSVLEHDEGVATDHGHTVPVEGVARVQNQGWTQWRTMSLGICKLF